VCVCVCGGGGGGGDSGDQTQCLTHAQACVLPLSYTTGPIVSFKRGEEFRVHRDAHGHSAGGSSPGT
jgi:hypothetical protein